MSVKKKCKDFSYNSFRVTDEDLGIWADTFTLGVKCHGRPRPNPHPGTHDKLHVVSFTHSGCSSIEGVHSNSDELHGFSATHFGGDNMDGAQYGSDRLHEVQKDIRNTITIWGEKIQ